MPEAHAAAPSTALLADPISRLHDTGPGHPEQPARYDAVMQALTPLVPSLTRIASRVATDDEIALVHTREIGRAHV